jgi:arylsulfatase A
MTRRECLGASLAALPIRAAQRLPNIVFILADDLGWGDLRVYNRESKIPTPNIDRLAASGVRFTDMHSTSAVCTPTRYSLMTGRYCWRSPLKKGVLNGYSPNLIEPGRSTVASMLKRAGYTTAGVGKWHLGLGTDEKTDYSRPLRPGPVQHGFDYFYGIPASLDMAPYLYFENDRAVEPPTSSTPGQGGDNPRGAFWRAGAMAPSFSIENVMPTLTDKAVEVIRRNTSRPYFLYFAMTGPHTPWVPTESFRNRTAVGEYGDFVVQMDDTVGRILRAIEDGGTADNTLVVFTSDNGAYWPPDEIERYGHRSNDGWRGMKADIHEAGHRVPFIARWPGRIPPGSVRHDIGTLADMYATFAEVAGLKLNAGEAEDSFSIARPLQGRGRRDATPVILHSEKGLFALRDGPWKFIEGLGSGGFTQPQTVAHAAGEPPGALYHLANDPGETRNLWTREPAVVQRMQRRLNALRQSGRSRPA